MTEMFGEAWSPMSVPDLAPDDDDDDSTCFNTVAKETLKSAQSQRDLKYEGGLKSKFRFVITFLFFIVHT